MRFAHYWIGIAMFVTVHQDRLTRHVAGIIVYLKGDVCRPSYSRSLSALSH